MCAGEQTFVWYINKNHPVFVGFDVHIRDEVSGHAVVCSGYELSSESLYFHDSNNLANEKFIPYERFLDHSIADYFKGYVTIRYIVIYP